MGVGAVVLGIIARIVFPFSVIHVSVRAEEILPGGITNSMLVLIIVDLLLIALAFAATRTMRSVPQGLQNVMETIIEAMYNFFGTINKKFLPTVFPLIATVFLLVITSNWLGLLPGFGSIGICHKPEAPEARMAGSFDIAIKDPYAGMSPFFPAAAEGTVEEHILGCQAGETIIDLFRAPSADLNMTLALALIAFCYVEYMGFRTLGFGYLGKFFNFKGGPIGFVVGFFELISEFARIPAFMFRLFGNIFAGEVLLVVMIFLIPLGLPLPFYFFEAFVGFMQAFIFAVLIIAFVGLAAESHDTHTEGASEAHH